MQALNLLKKITLVISVLFTIPLTSFVVDGGFLDRQKSNSRVRAAYIEKENLLAKRLKPFNITLDAINILITAYKSEQQLTIYIKKPFELTYTKFASYDICSSSGILGPKRKAGDSQVPEGFYYIDRFNPSSNYFLSLGLNYPNKADKYRSGAANPGSDIFIHGKCVTVGCLPMTDEKIKEIYILAIQAHQSGQTQIPVYIFPFRFNSIIGQRTMENYSYDKYLQKFWGNLKSGHDKFSASQQELKVDVNGKGEYVF
ncbi:MAG: hypothetical protein EOP47_30145 [Sphingobacteriaceae bacterium]|nr:MAG: hypothetical protein EOP47_30145 [Sphingobacteriaceae bacterium]